MNKKQIDWIGEFKVVIGQAGPYLTIITALMMAATFYHTTLNEWMLALGWHIPIWIFFAVIIIGGVVFLWFERRYMVSGFFSAWTEQWWKNDNPMKTSMEKMERDMEKIKEKLDIKDNE
jgi:hypothetical protein